MMSKSQYHQSSLIAFINRGLTYIQRKCGADFRFSTRRLWYDPIAKNDTIPHTRIDMGYRGRRRPPATNIYTKVSVVPYVLL